MNLRLKLYIQAFTRLADLFPVVDRHLLTSVKSLFLDKNSEVLIQKSPEAFAACSEARTVQEFFDAHHALAGFPSMAQYYADSNPMNWVDSIVRPVLVVNSEDDMVCLKASVTYQITAQF